MKITESELNIAYFKVKELREDQLSPEEGQVLEVGIERNPLIDLEYFDQDSKFVTPIKLKFEWNSKLGSSGAYVLVSDVEVIHEDEDLED